MFLHSKILGIDPQHGPDIEGMQLGGRRRGLGRSAASLCRHRLLGQRRHRARGRRRSLSP
ncbi:MAG: hypothetical protein DMG40_25555 [Acidobacteria bacterium]|nr:MAG: hypothetical protein DMG40_25555 [Acidobacteriota bacterium]